MNKYKIKNIVMALLTGSAVTVAVADNPAIRDVFTADPAPIVHDDTVYVYLGQDEAKPDEFYVMNRWLVYSSQDMVNWTSHGSPLKPTDFEWCKSDAWAGHVVEKNGKFYWYITCEHKTVHGKSVGVAVSDSPTGPFKDARGTALVTNDMTKATGISWDDIDPAAFIDDDGQAWLFWGNQKAYYAKLKPSMIELDGPIQVIPDDQVRGFTEAPWIHKRGDLYYLSYATGFPEKTAYSTSKSIAGPWTYRGLLAEGAANSNTIHQGIIDFKDQSYFFYHTGMVQHPNSGGSYRRAMAVDYLYYNDDGSIKPIVQTSKGVNPAGQAVTFSGAVAESASTWVKNTNIVIDEDLKSVFLPLKPDADLSSFDPEFVLAPNVSISPVGRQNFSKGVVDYRVIAGNTAKTYKVTAAVNHNPVVAGYYADPEIIFSKKDGKYYLYPTSDGFTGWSGTYFETFSSPDLVHWTNEGVILDLKKDVSWANRNAWAPTGIERKVNGKYKYYYYFTAAQKIGVAVADDPAGPFTDSGKPLIDFRPEGVSGGQEIDPDVFHDPVSGKSFLYWGNGYMAVAQLNDDMVSIDPSTVKVITPDSSFREGAEVFYRNGKYYFLWSENDTRDADYRVRYATSDSPVGPLKIAGDNLVIAKNEARDIYATGHNSVINKPDTDEWFIVYHRFTRPAGKEMGGDAGFHREVCIDRLQFDKDGSIIQTIPTL